MLAAVVTSLQEARGAFAHRRIRPDLVTDLASVDSRVKTSPTALVGTLVILSQVLGDLLDTGRPQSGNGLTWTVREW